MPLPPLAKPHWEGAAESELRVLCCRSCGQHWFPPSLRCPRCLSDAIEWQPVSGRGEVLGWCVFHRAYFADLDLPLPFTVIHVRLEEGPQLFSNPEDPQASLPVGQRVEAVFVPRGDGVALVRFRATEEN